MKEQEFLQQYDYHKIDYKLHGMHDHKGNSFNAIPDVLLFERTTNTIIIVEYKDSLPLLHVGKTKGKPAIDKLHDEYLVNYSNAGRRRYQQTLGFNHSVYKMTGMKTSLSDINPNGHYNIEVWVVDRDMHNNRKQGKAALQHRDKSKVAKVADKYKIRLMNLEQFEKHISRGDVVQMANLPMRNNQSGGVPTLHPMSNIRGVKND